MLRILILSLIVVLVLLAYGQSDSGRQSFSIMALLGGAQKVVKASDATLPASAFQTIEWIDLIPEKELDAILNPPDYIMEIEDGSAEDQIESNIENNFMAPDDPYQQALVSTNVVAEMEGEAVRVPGFIVPLEFDDKQNITQFFLVPFFGACIHLPPPPPNQIIFVEYSEGIELSSLYTPFWVSGIIKTSLTENDVATAAYSIKMQYFEEYTE